MKTNDKIYYFHIPTTKDSQIERKTLSMFADHLRESQDNNLAFADCTKEEDIFYLFLDELNMNRIVDFFKTNYEDYTIKNLTTSVLKGEYIDEEFEKTFAEEKNRIKLREYLINNISKDEVLDKIIEKGINNLSEIELEILKL